MFCFLEWNAEIPGVEVLWFKHTMFDEQKPSCEFCTGILENTVAEIDSAVSLFAVKALEIAKINNDITERLEHRAKLPLDLSHGIRGGLILREHLRSRNHALSCVECKSTA